MDRKYTLMLYTMVAVLLQFFCLRQPEPAFDTLVRIGILTNTRSFTALLMRKSESIGSGRHTPSGKVLTPAPAHLPMSKLMLLY